MIRATRRAVVLGALALPVAARAARLKLGGEAVLLYDPALEAGRSAAAMHGGKALAIEGDRIRFAREVFAAKPAAVAGVSRHADAVLIEDVARELGYRREALSASGPVLEWRFAPIPC